MLPIISLTLDLAELVLVTGTDVINPWKMYPQYITIFLPKVEDDDFSKEFLPANNKWLKTIKIRTEILTKSLQPKTNNLDWLKDQSHYYLLWLSLC